MHEEGPLERSRRALERLPKHGYENAPTLEISDRVAKPLGAGKRVVLVPASLKARRAAMS